MVGWVWVQPGLGNPCLPMKSRYFYYFVWSRWRPLHPLPTPQLTHTHPCPVLPCLCPHICMACLHMPPAIHPIHAHLHPVHPIHAHMHVWHSPMRICNVR